MKMKTLRTFATKVTATDHAVRRLCMGTLIGWGIVATAILALGGSGGGAPWLTGPFLLFGVGIGVMVVGFWKSEVAFRIAVVVGGGLAAVTAISQFLILAGAFDPVTVGAVETGVLALLWVAMERESWSTRS